MSDPWPHPGSPHRLTKQRKAPPNGRTGQADPIQPPPRAQEAPHCHLLWLRPRPARRQPLAAARNGGDAGKPSGARPVALAGGARDLPCVREDQILNKADAIQSLVQPAFPHVDSHVLRPVVYIEKVPSLPYILCQARVTWLRIVHRWVRGLWSRRTMSSAAVLPLSCLQVDTFLDL